MAEEAAHLRDAGNRRKSPRLLPHNLLGGTKPSSRLQLLKALPLLSSAMGRGPSLRCTGLKLPLRSKR